MGIKERVSNYYTLLEESTALELSSKVRVYLDNGWDIYGPPIVAVCESKKLYIQCVVKQISTKEDPYV